MWAVLWIEGALLVGDWSETLSFYNANGQQIMKDRTLGKLPLTVHVCFEHIPKQTLSILIYANVRS